MLRISRQTAIPLADIELHAIAAQGPGGQHVNKAATAIHLRFDIAASSLPEFYKERLLTLKHRHISGDGIIVIKAQEFRSQEQNREAALERLRALIASVAVPQKARKATRPTRASQQRRLDSKKKHSTQKRLRGGTED